MSKFTNAIRTLAKMKALDAESAEKLLNAHVKEQDGGPGSGNFGHSGRPGKKGGSAPKGGGASGSIESGGKTGSFSVPSGPTYKTIKTNPQNVEVNWSEPHHQSTNYNGEKAYRGNSAPASEKIDPTGAVMSEAQKKIRRDNQRNQNMAMADRCFENAKKPEFADVQKELNIWEGILSKPQPGRPTPEESKALTDKRLKNIYPELKPYFKEVYEKRLKDEPNITNDLCDIADSIGAEMYGLDKRIKSAGLNDEGVCRVAEKIAEDMQEKGWTYEQAVDNFSDMVRYTQACTEDTLVDQFEKTMDALKKKKYKVVKVKNTWDTFSEKNPYRGVNCVVESPNGTRFELQFHTPESIVGKEIQHPWYEKFRTQGIDPAKKAELGKKMYENMKGMKAPRNVGRISNYPPSGYD